MIEFVALIKVILLGIVEGITEFLPISSTGHLIAFTAILDFQQNAGGTFEIFIQLGAVLAVVFFYRQRILDQVRRVTHERSVQHFWAALVIATIPAGVIGFLFRSTIKAVLFNPTVVALTLIIGGVILLFVERRPAAQVTENAVTELEAVTFPQAILIGFAQVIALIPGVSRSAASIIGGMFTGLSRQTATEFSFFLAMTTLGGATVAELVLSLDEIHGDELVYLLVGLVISALVAWVAVGWLLRYVQQHNFRAFGIYRIAAGFVLLLMIVVGLL